MESEIVWDKFRGPGFLEPYIVHFPNYTKGELPIWLWYKMDIRQAELPCCYMFFVVTG